MLYFEIYQLGARRSRITQNGELLVDGTCKTAVIHAMPARRQDANIRMPALHSLNDDDSRRRLSQRVKPKLQEGVAIAVLSFRGTQQCLSIGESKRNADTRQRFNG
jgi:hypothetical protein